MHRLTTIIAVHRLRLEMEIGWLECEKGIVQPVEISFRMLPEAPVPAGRSDRIADTVCYATLCEHIRAFCDGKALNLIEHLGTEIFALLRQEVPETIRLWVKIAKLHPPIPGIQGPSEFICTDLPPERAYSFS